MTANYARFKGIDLIVHNVGGSSAPSVTVAHALWQQALDEDLFSAVRPTADYTLQD